MIKLTFNNFSFTTDGIISKGNVEATIKIFITNKWFDVASKKFITKITLHKDDKFDLDKAYKYIQAKLERDAYAWAGKEAFKELYNIQKSLRVFEDFTEKASHIVAHDNHYLETL